MKNTKNIKSNTKRIIALALALLMIVTLFTACGKKDKPAVSPDASTDVAGTADAGNENNVPSIDSGEETATTVAGKDDKDNQTATTVAGTANAGKNDKDKTPAGKPASKPTSNKPSSGTNPTSNKPSSGKPESKPTTRPAETTTRPAPKPVETTTQSSTPKAQTAYFRASTGEKIEYYKYKSLNGATCTGISESNGKIVATYDKGANNEWIKCDNCGKYLCEGCQPVVPDKCTYCGKATCVRYGNDGKCYYCGQPVKGDTCHDCPKSPRR